MQLMLFLTIMLMIPVYTWEFLMVYGIRIPHIKNFSMYKEYGDIFDFKMKWLICEQFIYFFNLCLLYMCVGCFKLSFEYDQDKYLINMFSQKIKNKDTSIWWRFLFYILKNIQCIVLVMLFINGSNNLNHFRNLGFMVFFVVYTTSESLYRKTSKTLIFFITIFIFG